MFSEKANINQPNIFLFLSLSVGSRGLGMFDLTHNHVIAKISREKQKLAFIPPPPLEYNNTTNIAF
jgi:hypothetical protein